jgi:hypothetical protein
MSTGTIYSDDLDIAGRLTYLLMIEPYVTTARSRTLEAKSWVGWAYNKPRQALQMSMIIDQALCGLGGAPLGLAEFQPQLGGSLNESRRVRQLCRQYHNLTVGVLNGGTGVLVCILCTPRMRC